MHQHDLSINLADLSATQELGAELGRALQAEAVIYLHGELGAGKTSLVRALLHALGYQGISKSPTFTMVEIYKLDELDLYHYDLYRLADPAELDFIGIRDYVASPGVKIFEWASKGHGKIPKADLEITMQMELQHHGRIAHLVPRTACGRQISDQIRSNLGKG